MLSRSVQNLSCSERVQPPQNNTAEVPASSRGAVHHLRRHAYKQREPVSRVEIDGDEMREPSGAGLRKSLYSQRMLPACRHLWHRQRPAPASVPRRGKAHSTPSPLGDGAAGRAWITVRASTFRALATAHLRCSSRASRSPRERRSLSPQRGPTRPPPATTAVPRPRLPSTARQPYQGAPARSRRRWAARRPPWPHSAARRARTRRPPGVPRGGAHRCAAKPPRLREPE